MINLKFSKMHGLGNDYVIIDEHLAEIIPEDIKGPVAENLCRRGFSIGADGVIFVAPATHSEADRKEDAPVNFQRDGRRKDQTTVQADIRFRIFNADGSEAEMCGNGIRCFAKYVYENGIIHQEVMQAETLGGIKELQLRVEDGEVVSVKVDMGTASFLTREIPMISDEEEFIEGELSINDETLSMTVLNVGNPHTVIFTTDLNNVALEEVGPLIENHYAFPERVNAHFVDLLERDEIEMITWERGSGVTLACGTGASSSVLAGYRLGFLDSNVLVHLPGGELRITVYQKDGKLGAFMEGDSVLVFEGEMKLDI